MENCIFCKIVRGEIPSIKVYEDDRVFVFEDINPISDGHTLVIPKKHAENIWEISPEDLSAIHLVSKKIAHAIKEVLQPIGIAFLQLNGKGAHQVVMHYHLHLVPRISGTPELPITNWDIKPGNRDNIKAIGKKITEAMK